MSLVIQLILAERYNAIRLDLDQLADALGMAKGTIENQIAKQTFPIPTYRDGGKRYADLRDVAEHLDRCRERAHEEIQAEG